MHEAVQRIHEASHLLREEGPKSDERGQLTEKTVQVMRESGGVRLLQSKDRGGYESHPNDFFEWVRAVASYSPSAGWVAGVVGVHPWEIALFDPKLQDEIYGADPDIWIASPYAPFGRAKPVEGGFLFSGDWPYSTGTDYCDWIILGGMVTDAEGNLPAGPPDIRHFILPRSDYEIVEGSWNVMGMIGTGSKNVRMTDAFIPAYRAYEAPKMVEGVYAREQRPDSPLYQMMFGIMFSAAIASGTLGTAQGAVREFREYMNGRVSVMGNVAKSDPFQLAALARAEADVDASVVHFEHVIAKLFDQVAAGEPITVTQRITARRDMVRGVDRVVTAIDELYRMGGASAIHTDTGRPLERFWRDLHAGGSHVCNVREPIYVGWGVNEFGGDIALGTLY